MTHMTTATSTPIATAMGNGNKKGVSNSLSVGDIGKHSSKLIDNKDVTKWTSSEVQHWIKEQCKLYELRKAIVEKFEMNGQALALLTKHDFLRRSPEGGEILYYALQRLINPNRADSGRLEQNGYKNGTFSPRPRIVELSPDDEESNDAPDLSTPKPIIEEPDDPPKIRKSHSEAFPNSHHQRYHNSHPFFVNQEYVSPTVLTMPAGAAAAFFHQHHQRRHGIPDEFIHTHHPYPHMHHPHVYPHLFHQYHPMMTARGILIEVLDDIDPSNLNSDGTNGSVNSASSEAPEQLYMVTINGQRYVMNEAQVRQLVTEVHQQQTYQENIQQQQQYHQQQQYFQQQQNYQQQQQQHYQQQQQHHHHHQQQSQQPSQPPQPTTFPDQRTQFQPQQQQQPRYPFPEPQPTQNRF